MTRWTLGLLLLVAAVMLAADCPVTRADVAPPHIADINDLHRLGYGLRWTTDLMVPSDERLAEVEVLDDIVATLEKPSNLLTAISAKDGQLLWRHVVAERAQRLFAPFRSSSKREVLDDSGRPIALNNLIMINSENEIYFFSAADGHYVSSRNLPFVVATPPVVTENVAIYGAANGRVFGIDLVNGFKTWAYQMSAAVVCRPLLVKPAVFVADSAGVYAMLVGYSYSAEDKPGKLLWKGRAFERVQATAALNNQGIYVASEDQSLYSLNRATGRDRWIFRSTETLVESPITLGNSLYLPLPSGSLVSLDPSNGTELWRFPFKAKPIMLQEQRLLLCGAHNLWILDNQSGKPVSEVTIDPIRAVLRADKNSLIIVTPGGRIQRLDTEN